MEYTTKFIRKTLKKTIFGISSNPQFFSKNPEKDFSRTRKLPFKKRGIYYSGNLCKAHNVQLHRTDYLTRSHL